MEESTAVLTSFSKGTGADDKVGASTADEAHDIVGWLQVMPEAHVLMIEDIIRPVHPPEHLYTHTHRCKMSV